MTVYKYVDAVDAHYLESGSVKIGTTDGFALIEGPRADPDEGKLSLFQSTVLSVQGEDCADARRAAVMGIKIGSGHIFDARAGARLADENCLCFSLAADQPDEIFHKPQAVFEVADLRAFLETLTASDKRLTQWAYGRVLYGERKADVCGEHFMPDSLLKPPCFDWEREVRAIWRCTGIYEVDSDLPMATIITEPNEQISVYFRRVR